VDSAVDSAHRDCPYFRLFRASSTRHRFSAAYGLFFPAWTPVTAMSNGDGDARTRVEVVLLDARQWLCASWENSSILQVKKSKLVSWTASLLLCE
jgi:hypothetical protein